MILSVMILLCLGEVHNSQIQLLQWNFLFYIGQCFELSEPNRNLHNHPRKYLASQMQMEVHVARFCFSAYVNNKTLCTFQVKRFSPITKITVWPCIHNYLYVNSASDNTVLLMYLARVETVHGCALPSNIVMSPDAERV